MRVILFISILSSLLEANKELAIGCSSSVNKEIQGCTSENILADKRDGLFDVKDKESSSDIDEINISKTVKSVKVIHDKQELLIVRTVVKNEKISSPSYIEPMNISTVKTVGELETLNFIKSLEKKKNRLLIDTRVSQLYKKSTIPGALNLPYTMLKKESKYFKEVLELLGLKELRGKWKVKNVPTLLIFDNGITDNKASESIKTLLKLSYPSNKILYYRGGIRSWESLGLTLF